MMISKAMHAATYAIAAANFLRFTAAQFPAQPTDLTIAKSQISDGVTISFKQIDVCEQAPGVTAYSGFVNMPGNELADVGGYDIHMYFLYFEAREKPTNSPLGIYLAGGPGEASSYSAMSSENGPCWVNIDSTGTMNNRNSFTSFMTFHSQSDSSLMQKLEREVPRAERVVGYAGNRKGYWPALFGRISSDQPRWGSLLSGD